MFSGRNQRKVSRTVSQCLEALEQRQMLSAESRVWSIAGDGVAGDANDTIVIQRSAQNRRMLQAVVNGEVVATRKVGSVREIRVNAGDGDDVVQLRLGKFAKRIQSRFDGGAGNDRLLGDNSADVLIGGAGDDVLHGNGGSDKLMGGAGDDELDGGAGNDNLIGGKGNDRLEARRGRNRLAGGAGNDVLSGHDRRDQFLGGAGRNVFNRRGGTTTLGLSMAAEWGGRPLTIRDIGQPNSLAQVADDAALQQWVIDGAVSQWQWSFGQPSQWYRWYEGGIDNGAVYTLAGADTASVRSALSTEIAASYSGTNTQEAGVDEADLVETDGQFIYSISGSNLVITSTAPAAAMEVLSTTELDGNISGIYLHEGRLTVVSQGGHYWPGIFNGAGFRAMAMPILEMSKSSVKVFDVSDPASPLVVEETEFDGTISTSRSIDGRVYLVVSNYLSAPAPAQVAGDDGKMYYESEEAYRAGLEETWRDLVPSWSTSLRGGAEQQGSLVAAPDAYLGGSTGYNQLTSILLIDSTDESAGIVSSVTVGAGGGTVYVSSQSLYLLEQTWWSTPGTSVYKFALAPDAITYEASGFFEGSVLNSFSVDEQDGRLRVATTNWTWGGGGAVNGTDPGAGDVGIMDGSDGEIGEDDEWDDEWDDEEWVDEEEDDESDWEDEDDDGGWDDAQFVSNGLVILEQVGDQLKVVGGLTGIAPGETIHSVRFLENRAYMVTFRQIDPLFVIDLSDPIAPTVSGELKIPGFSRYLQPLSDDLVLGIGQAEGRNGWFDQLEFSLFDVSNPSAPTRVGAVSFDDQSAWRFDWDHHAVNYFADEGILAVPVSKEQGNYNAGLQLLKVSSSGFTDAGFIQQPNGVSRGILIDDILYTIGRTHIQAQALADPEVVLGSVQIGELFNGGGGIIPFFPVDPTITLVAGVLSPG